MEQPELPLLTICVPTYNRASLLPECLASLAKQLNENDDLRSRIEVIVSDNGSSDGTVDVIESFKARFSNGRYIRHESNLGLDRNVNGCIRAATGRFIWIFSDDDVMSYGTLEIVVRLLETHPHLGMIHLDSYGFRGPISPLTVSTKTYSIKEFETSSAFLRDVSYWITFLSANIFRRDAEYTGFKIENFDGTLFGFLAFYLGVLISSKSHARVFGPMFARREDNVVGGYKLFKTFTVDLNCLFREGILRGLDSRDVDVINAAVLTDFLPSFTLKLKDAVNSGSRIKLGPIGPLFKTCWRYPEMWLVTIPVRLAPRSVARGYWKWSSKVCVVFRYLRRV